ncbi:unnamed protein product [Oikopleura dioica]|uniref:C2H2-type domain-containing protein n=1 Tax=Oikopleura dioica TaxID=34765 RepID=E4WWL1_OIKDI|nr:unnamed protein product [Oikopleura dioica]
MQPCSDAYTIQPDINTSSIPLKKKKENETDLIKLAEADVDELAAVEEVSNQCRIKYNISLSEKYLIDTSKEKLTGIPSSSCGRGTKGVYRFHCDSLDCNKSFTKRCDLKRHILTHTGEKPFKCEKCEKSFSLKSTLVKHVRRMHSEQKPDKYNCHVCDKCFSDSGGLKRHMRIHTQARPFKCVDCTKVFKRSDQLVRHRKTCDKNLSKTNQSTPTSLHVIVTPLCKEMMEMFDNKHPESSSTSI